MRCAARRLLAASVCATLILRIASAEAADLYSVYREALANDPAYRQAHATYMAAREARPEAWSALLPQISGTTGKSWAQSSGLSTQLSSNSTGTGIVPSSFYGTLSSVDDRWSLDLSQQVFNWSAWMNVKAADRQAAEAEATYRAAGQNLILRVATGYFNILSALDTLKAQQRALEAYDLQLQQADMRYKAGLIGIPDVEQALAARDTAAAALISAKQFLATTEDQLAVVTGRQYDTLAEPDSSMPLVMPRPAVQGDWVRTSLRQNFALIASRLAADVARETVHAAFGGHLPVLSLVASRTFGGTRTNEIVSGVGRFAALPSWSNDRQIDLEVSVPIFSGGGVSAEVHRAQYQWIAAKDAMQETTRATEQQARDAYLGVISGIAKVKAFRQALTSAEAAYRATEAAYRVGTQTEVDVLNALSVLVLARTNYATSRYSYIISLVQLRYAAGTLDTREVLKINHWLTVPAPVSPGATTPEGMTPPVPPPIPKPPRPPT